MAYTIPSSADTTEQAILAVASAVKGEQVTGGDGSVNKALDILADALAGQDVTVPMTQQGAILALAQYVGGGGGGVDVGTPTYIVGGSTAPEIGDYTSDYSDVISGIAIGDAIIVPIAMFSTVSFVAAGATVTTCPSMDDDPTACAAYVVTVDDGQITAVAPWGGTLTPGTFDPGMGTLNVWSFDVPALEYDDDTGVGQVLCLHLHK